MSHPRSIDRARRASAKSRFWRAAGLGILVALSSVRPALAQNTSEPDRYPLDPPDLSSPEATLDTFLTESMAAIDASAAGNRAELEAHADRGFQALQIAAPTNDAEFLKVAETSLYLFEILIRVELPPARKIPGPDLAAEDMPRYWVIPHTELTLERFDSDLGEPLGYRFSKETIERLPEFYELAQDLPVKARFAKYAGVAERFRLRPGFSAPRVLQAFVQGLSPAWFKPFGGEPWWKWIAVGCTALATAVLLLLFFRLAALLGGRASPATGFRALVRPLLAVVVIVVFAMVRHITMDWIRLTGTDREVVVGILEVLTHAAAIWLIFLLAERIANAVIRVREMGVYALDTQLVRLVSKLVAVLLSLYAIVNLAESLGVPVAPVLAGLGVGGLAVALAVRPTLENILGGFVLFADAPVRVGDFCRFGDKVGTVEAIGLRSVRVRGIDRTVITIPNADFSQMELVNFTRRDMILFHKTIHLRYETTAEQLRVILARLREVLIEHPKISPDPARVRLIEYGESSLDLEIFAYVQTQDWSEFLAIQEDLNFRIRNEVEAAGSAFAFPSQTLYVEPSKSFDPNRIDQAEPEATGRRQNEGSTEG